MDEHVVGFGLFVGFVNNNLVHYKDKFFTDNCSSNYHRPTQSSCESAPFSLDTLGKISSSFVINNNKKKKFKTHLKIIIHLSLQRVIKLLYLKWFAIYPALPAVWTLFGLGGGIKRMGTSRLPAPGQVWAAVWVPGIWWYEWITLPPPRWFKFPPLRIKRVSPELLFFFCLQHLNVRSSVFDPSGVNRSLVNAFLPHAVMSESTRQEFPMAVGPWAPPSVPRPPSACSGKKAFHWPTSFWTIYLVKAERWLLSSLPDLLSRHASHVCRSPPPAVGSPSTTPPVVPSRALNPIVLRPVHSNCCFPPLGLLSVWPR